MPNNKRWSILHRNTTKKATRTNKARNAEPVRSSHRDSRSSSDRSHSTPRGRLARGVTRSTSRRRKRSRSPSPPSSADEEVDKPRRKKPRVTFKVPVFSRSSFFQKLQELALFRPNFFDSYVFNVNMFLFPKSVNKLRGEALYDKLCHFQSKILPFFQESFQIFLKMITIPRPLPEGLSSTNVWTLPPGLLQSFRTPQWRYFFDLHCGKSFYPTTPIPSDNIFLVEKFEKNFLLNPPYADWEEKLSDKFNQPLRNHLLKIVDVSFNSGLVQVVLLPNLTGTTWFDKLISHPFILPVFFLRKLIFLRSKDLNLHGLSNHYSVALIIGIFSPVNLYIKNNLCGNFLLKNKAFSSFKNILQLSKVPLGSNALGNYMNISAQFCQKAHQLYVNSVTKFDEFQIEQDFSKYSLVNTPVHQNQLVFSQQKVTHEFYANHMLKVPDGLTRSKYHCNSVPEKLLQNPVTTISLSVLWLFNPFCPHLRPKSSI